MYPENFKEETKMKKKLVAAMMVAVMTAGMALPVSAADTAPISRTVSVAYEEDSTFTLTIPATVTLSENAGATATVGLDAINVSTTEKVQISVTGGISDGKVTLTDINDSSNTCSSTVSLTEGDEGLASDAVIAEFTMESHPLTAALYFTALGNVPAGTYSGQMTYQASIVSTADAGATGE